MTLKMKILTWMDVFIVMLMVVLDLATALGFCVRHDRKPPTEDEKCEAMRLVTEAYNEVFPDNREVGTRVFLSILRASRLSPEDTGWRMFDLLPEREKREFQEELKQPPQFPRAVKYDLPIPELR